MNDTATATLTEKELFVKWRKTKIIIELGGQTYELNADDLVDYDYDGMIFDPCLTDDCDSPSNQLDEVEVALESALDNIRLARRSFDRFRKDYDEKCESEIIDMTSNYEASAKGTA